MWYYLNKLILNYLKIVEKPKREEDSTQKLTHVEVFFDKIKVVN